MVGITPLFDASVKGHTEMVDQLLRSCCLLDLTNDVGVTSLHAACFNAHEAVVRLLLAAGASATPDDSRGRSAMDWATKPRHAAVRQILLKHVDAGAPGTQLIAVSDVSAPPRAQPWR